MAIKGKPLRESGTERGWSQENWGDSALLRTPRVWKFHSPGADGSVSREKQENAGTKLNIQSHDDRDESSHSADDKMKNPKHKQNMY